MEGFTSFLANNYIWFLVISLILLFALIGYLVDIKDMKTGKKLRRPKEELKIVDFSSIDQGKSLNESIKEEKNELNLDEYAKKASGTETIENNVESPDNQTADTEVVEDIISPEPNQIIISTDDEPKEELPDLDDNN